MKRADLQSMFVSRQRSFVASQSPFAAGPSGVAPVPQRCVTAQRQRAPRPQASAACPTSYVMLHLPLAVAATGQCWLTNIDCKPVFPRISPCFLACRPYLVDLGVSSRVGRVPTGGVRLANVLVHSFTTLRMRYAFAAISPLRARDRRAGAEPTLQRRVFSSDAIPGSSAGSPVSRGRPLLRSDAIVITRAMLAVINAFCWPHSAASVGPLFPIRRLGGALFLRVEAVAVDEEEG